MARRERAPPQIEALAQHALGLARAPETRQAHAQDLRRTREPSGAPPPV
jgi:hypothetical protein